MDKIDSHDGKSDSTSCKTYNHRTNGTNLWTGTTGETEAKNGNETYKTRRKSQLGISNKKSSGTTLQQFPMWRSKCKGEKLYILVLRGRRPKAATKKRPEIEIHKISAKELIQILEDIFVTTLIIAFKRQNFICRKQWKTESLEQFHADLVELAARADCGDREDERVRDIFTATMTNEKIAEKLLAETRSPQSAYEYAIRRGKRIQHSRILKTNPLSPTS